jgi:acyl-CoA reductase-like NAD-dependent aldehyde dehydrogenase
MIFPMQIINPATGKFITEVKILSPKEILHAYTQARAAQPLWAATPLPDRLAAIGRFHRLLDAQSDHLAGILTAEVGKPLAQSLGEIRGAMGRIQFFLSQSEQWLAEEWMTTEGATLEKISHEPLGVIGNISAWNYPYLVGVNVFIPALIAGNAVLYKPSEYATLTGLEIGKLLHEAGIPESVMVTLPGDKTVGEALLELPLDGYFFTGSYRTGKYIYEKVAPKMVPCQLELGGKDPLYVSADNAHLTQVAEAAVEGVFYNNGQSCCAVERIYVHASLYEPFVTEFVRQTQELRIGTPEEAGVFIGPLTRSEQIHVLEAQVADALAKGARLLTGGKRIEGEGYYFEPTVLADVNHDMLVMREESFGPIIGIQSVADDAEAVERMLDTDYGLTAAVYADNRQSAEPILDRMNTGTVYWNCCDRVSATVPWAGRKQSGMGATLSYLGIRAFTRPKAYHLRGKWH